jgi:hypothetical protein
VCSARGVEVYCGPRGMMWIAVRRESASGVLLLSFVLYKHHRADVSPQRKHTDEAYGGVGMASVARWRPGMGLRMVSG